MSEQKRERWERDGRAPGYVNHQRNANVQDPMEMDQTDFGNNFFNEEDETPVDMEMIKEKIKLVPLSDMDFSEPPDDVMDVDCSLRDDILARLRLTLPEHANFEGSPKQDIRAQHTDCSQTETLGEGIVLKQVKTEITEIGMEVGDATATAAKVAAEAAADVMTGGVVAEAGPCPDFSSWTVEDDILLKNAMEVGAAMEALAKGAVKFSQRYSVRELRERWRALLYDPVISEAAALRMLKSEALATNPGKLSNLNRLKYPQVSNRKRKLKSVRTHYYKMRIKITAENNPNHSAANLDNESVESLPDIAPKEPEPRMEESTFSQMVRLFAAGGVGAVVRAIPSVAMGKALQEDSSFIGILPQKDIQAQTSEVIVGLDFSRKQGVERSKSLQELDTLTAEHMMEPPNLNNPNSLVAAQTHLDSGGPVKTSVDSAVELSARNDATQKHSVEELRTCADQRFKDSELDSSQIKPPPCILVKVVDKHAHATEPLDLQCWASEVKETCAIDAVSSADKPLIVDVPGPEHMICVLNTEDTDIPSPPPGSATHLPSLFSPMYLSSEMKGDENESGISGGGYEGTDDFEISEHEFVPLVSEDKRNIVRVDQVVKLEPTSKGLENDARYTMNTQGLLSTVHSASADVAAQTNDKEDMDPPESAAVHVSKSLLLTSQGAANANDISAAADQSKSHSEVPGFTKELALPSQAGVPNQMEQGLCCTDQTVDVPATTKSAAACQDYEDGLESDEEMPSLSDVESMILDMDLDPAFDEDALARAESRRMYRRHRKTLMRLEQGANAALERTMTLQGAIAVLYGHHLRYFITRNEVLLGRVTADIVVDIDLGKEGRANKVSRRQATIKLKEDGVFYLKNLGRRDLSVNNIPIANGQHASLGSNCLIEVGGMRFIFEINKKLVRQRVVDMLYSRQHG